MKLFAVLSGLFLGGILLTGGYAMAYFSGADGYFAPLLLAGAALIALPLLYWLKAARRLPRPVGRIAFATMLGGLMAAWIPLALSGDRAPFFAPMVVFSAVWLVASLPVLRAGIRHRP